MDKLVLSDLVMAFLGVFLNQEQERILDTINVFKCTRPRMLLMWKLSNPTLLNWSRSSALTQRFGGEPPFFYVNFPGMLQRFKNQNLLKHEKGETGKKKQSVS